MGKDLFQLMREKDIATTNFLPTKKEIKESSVKLAKDMIDSGNFNKEEVYAQALRLKEAISNIEAEFKKHLGDESFEAFGLKATFRNGGDSKIYEDDDVYTDLKNKLDQRKALLDVALKSDDIIFDADGVEVPKVRTKPRKSSLAITY